jgi:kumamolisin
MTITSNISNYISYIGQDPNAVRLGNTGLTPTAVVNAYGVPAGTGAGVKIGIISLGGGWSAADFDRSMTDLGLHSTITSANIRTVLVDGAVNNFDGNGASIENTLDLYCVAAVAPQANITIYIGVDRGIGYNTDINVAKNANSTNGFVNVLNRALQDNPDIITISWGSPEKINYLGNNYYCGDFLSDLLANAVAKGTTVFVATGDSGSEPTVGSNILGVQYPASSPNVVAVGGTYLSLYPNGLIRSESYFTQGGGGVSDIFSVPVWQQGLTYKTYSTIPGTRPVTLPLVTRGIPDIAAPMNAYDLYLAGAIQQVGGTSAATPIMAGVLARSISALGSRPPQLNPVFYNNPGAFYDFASGDDASYISEGYLSTPGWDPVVGLGRIIGSAFTGMLAPQRPKIKTADNAWSTVANTWVKTNSTTWTQIRAVWAKTVNGWQQTH